MSKSKKVWLGILIFLVILVVALLVVVPYFLNVDRYRPQAAAFIEQQTGKPAEIGRLALTVLPRLSIRVEDFALKNPAGFPPGYFVQARRIDAVIDARALWKHQLVITSLDLEAPTVSLLSDLKGNWNSENHPAPDPPGDKPLFSLSLISNLTISRGMLSAATLLPSGQAGPAFLEAHGVSCQLRQINADALAAMASPHPDPAGSRPLVGEGTLKVESLAIANLLLTHVKTQLRLFPQQFFFDGLTLNCYDGAAAGGVSFSLDGPNPRYSTEAKLSGVNMAKLLDAFPDTRGKMTGTLNGTAKLEIEVLRSPDPLAGIQGTGQVSVRNGRLPGLNWDQNLLQLARQAKMGPASGDPSSFSSIATDFAIGNNRIKTAKTTIAGNGVDVFASGSLALAGEGDLDVQGVAKVAAQQNALTNVLGSLAGATLKGGRMAFPFILKGTLKNPKFTLKSAAIGNRPGTVSGPGAAGKGAMPPIK